nr:unnamed protein product [Digitaria exilis]
MAPPRDKQNARPDLLDHRAAVLIECCDGLLPRVTGDLSLGEEDSGGSAVLVPDYTSACLKSAPLLPLRLVSLLFKHAQLKSLPFPLASATVLQALLLAFILSLRLSFCRFNAIFCSLPLLIKGGFGLRSGCCLPSFPSGAALRGGALQLQPEGLSRYATGIVLPQLPKADPHHRVGASHPGVAFYLSILGAANDVLSSRSRRHIFQLRASSVLAFRWRIAGPFLVSCTHLKAHLLVSSPSASSPTTTGGRGASLSAAHRLYGTSALLPLNEAELAHFQHRAALAGVLLPVTLCAAAAGGTALDPGVFEPVSDPSLCMRLLEVLLMSRRHRLLRVEERARQAPVVRGEPRHNGLRGETVGLREEVHDLLDLDAIARPLIPRAPPFCGTGKNSVSAVATLGDTLPPTLSTDEAGEPPRLPCSSEPTADGAGDLLPLVLFANTLGPNASAPDTVRAVVSTDVGDPSSWSRSGCIRGDGFFSCLSAGTCFLAAPPSTLRGYGWAGFLLGRGGGICIAGAVAPVEVLLLPEDSLTTCSTTQFRHQETAREKQDTTVALINRG